MDDRTREPARTGSGKIVTCDGCKKPVMAGFDVTTQVFPIDPEVSRAVYGTAALVYIVCPPRAEGWHPCLDMARLADEMYDSTRCRVPDCDGTRCRW